MKRSQFPTSWNEARVRRVLEHYERQTEDEVVAEDEAAFESRGQTVMVVPKQLVPDITRLIERRRSVGQTGAAGAARLRHRPRTEHAAAERPTLLGTISPSIALYFFRSHPAL
jgi:hypothetical protein